MRKINYKSDFDAVLRLRDCKDPDKFVPWPDCDFEVVFWTSGKARCHTASRNGGTYTNCFATEDGGIHFVFDNHRMGIGTLKWEPHFALPNGIYPDGIQDIYRKADLGITLVDGEGDCSTTADVEVLVPYIKFKYEDLTDAEKAELGKPATDAAASVAELERSVEKAEAGRVANEKSRVAAETARQAAEDTRQGQEAQREEAEADREENEAERMSAETARAEEFATWEDEIDSKADRSELSNIIAEEPLAPDNFPDINTYTREELKKDLFRDLWLATLAMFPLMPTYEADVAATLPDGSQYGLNGLVFGYETALKVMAWSKPGEVKAEAIFHYGGRMPSDVPTLFPFFANGIQSMSGTWSACGHVRVLTLYSFNGATVMPNNITNMFATCSKLETIYGVMDMRYVHSKSYANTFGQCYMLASVRVSRLGCDFWLQQSPLLTLDSAAYLVAHAANTAAITVTVHPDVYAKLTDEANAEWHQVLIDAAAKNITFATT